MPSIHVALEALLCDNSYRTLDRTCKYDPCSNKAGEGSMWRGINPVHGRSTCPQENGDKYAKTIGSNGRSRTDEVDEVQPGSDCACDVQRNA